MAERVAAIICEYNPLHLGHARQWEAVRRHLGEDAAILCLMSGNFVQRGAPAVFRKDLRARAAVESGADLVLELPLTCALRSAEGFAAGGVEILEKLQSVDALCFGSETGDAAALWEAAALLDAPDFPAALRRELDTGRPFAAARAAAFEELGGDAEILRRPNDILAVEYCKALRRLGSSIRPLAVHRPGDYHAAEIDAETPSSSALRRQIEAGEDWEAFVPPPAFAALRGAPPRSLAWGERAVLARLRTLPDAAFEALPGGGEGLWRKLRRACREEDSLASVMQAVKSKRYAYTRIARMVLCAFLGLTEADLTASPPYVRALAFSPRGQALLRRLRRESQIPVVNAGEPPPDGAYFALERRAAMLYPLFARPGDQAPCEREEDLRVWVSRRN